MSHDTALGQPSNRLTERERQRARALALMTLGLKARLGMLVAQRASGDQLIQALWTALMALPPEVGQPPWNGGLPASYATSTDRLAATYLHACKDLALRLSQTVEWSGERRYNEVVVPWFEALDAAIAPFRTQTLDNL